jgi:hypothetical protein
MKNIYCTEYFIHFSPFIKKSTRVSREFFGLNYTIKMP